MSRSSIPATTSRPQTGRSRSPAPPPTPTCEKARTSRYGPHAGEGSACIAGQAVVHLVAGRRGRRPADVTSKQLLCGELLQATAFTL